MGAGRQHLGAPPVLQLQPARVDEGAAVLVLRLARDVHDAAADEHYNEICDSDEASYGPDYNKSHDSDFPTDEDVHPDDAPGLWED